MIAIFAGETIFLVTGRDPHSVSSDLAIPGNYENWQLSESQAIVLAESSLTKAKNERRPVEAFGIDHRVKKCKEVRWNHRSTLTV
jgi:hypothetical protein